MAKCTVIHQPQLLGITAFYTSPLKHTHVTTDNLFIIYSRTCCYYYYYY